MNKKMLSRDDAKFLRRIKYRADEPCKGCGRYARYTANDRCVYCVSHASTLFLLHKIHGASWPTDDVPDYIADDKKRLEDSNPQDAYNLSRYAKGVWIRAEPCRRKGHIGVRTSGNNCWLCADDKYPQVTVNTLPPDTIISRDDARLLDFKFYRTGNYCRKGHNAFRLVATGQCVVCLADKKKPA